LTSFGHTPPLAPGWLRAPRSRHAGHGSPQARSPIFFSGRASIFFSVRMLLKDLYRCVIVHTHPPDPISRFSIPPPPRCGSDLCRSKARGDVIAAPVSALSPSFLLTPFLLASFRALLRTGFFSASNPSLLSRLFVYSEPRAIGDLGSFLFVVPTRGFFLAKRHCDDVRHCALPSRFFSLSLRRSLTSVICIRRFPSFFFLRSWCPITIPARSIPLFPVFLDSFFGAPLVIPQRCAS